MSIFVLQSAPSYITLGPHFLMPHWLAHLGVLGLFLVAAVDSSVIPLSLPGSSDLLLLWLVANGGDPWLLVSFTIVGSLLGGYTTWYIGRKNGEAALRHYVPMRLLGRIEVWVESHPVLAVFLPALLPPPIPLLPFALASGALGVSRRRFLGVFGTARILRYAFVGWLGATYGRRIVNFAKMVHTHALRIHGIGDCRHLLWNMENSQVAQIRDDGSMRSAGCSIACSVKCIFSLVSIQQTLRCPL